MKTLAIKPIAESSLLGLLLVVMLFVNGAAAGLSGILPQSSHYQGSTHYYRDEGLLCGRIDFAVYDTLVYPDEFVGADGYTNPGAGRYVYAYQIFNDTSLSYKAVSYFAVLDVTKTAIAGIGAQDDSVGGIEPTPDHGHFDSGRVVWTFDGGYVYAGNHSWVLVFGSNHDWIPGSYDIKSPSFPAPPVPEPMTILLLGLGGVLLRLRCAETGNNRC